MVVLIAAAAPCLVPSRARAQWWEPGLFWGYPGPYYPPSVEALNQRTLNIIANAAADRGASNPAPSQTDIYYNRTRDPEFFERYDIETRRALEDRVARKPSRPRATAKAAAPTPGPVAPVVPIASFFNASDQLVWPNDAPTAGDLGPKRATSDAAARKVLDETRRRRSAQLATVTDARKKLLDYGRPALTYIRSHSTSRVADTFHLFLMSLYESLGQAANPPASAGS